MKTDRATANRIRNIWNKNGHRVRPVRNVLGGGTDADWGQDGTVTYPASSLTNVSADFMGDWRAADTWQRLDMLRVRSRSRQLERGNPLCIGFKRNMLNNVLGAKGFVEKVNVVTSKAFGDTSDGEPDEVANAAVQAVRDEFGQPENFSSRKRLSRRDFDRLIVSRLIFDGEVILRKMRGFKDNEFGFTWQFINPDYLDHNLNRVQPNGNIIRMGVEQDITYKFPVAYWFLQKRPNDFLYDFHQVGGDRYYSVPADEIIHFYLLTEDEEQTRGWPWVFAAAVTLFRLGKYQESALINAAIGAARGVYFEKKYPEGFSGDPRELNGEGDITIDLPQGSGLELPYGTEAKVVDMKYPDQEFGEFCNAMMLTAGMVFGTSYASTTGDLSKANFVSSRVGQLEEREQYMAIQEFIKDKWKVPGAREEIYRALLSRKLSLPISRFGKFNKVDFTGRRWKFVQPVDDMKANEMRMDNLLAAPSDIVAETSQEDFESVLKRCQKDKKLMEQYGLERVSSVGPAPVTGDGELVAPDAPPAGKKTV
jgi:lambda family phage portal protein